MTTIDALEAIGDLPALRHATLAIRLDSDGAVDELYAALGPPVNESGVRIADKSSPPRWEELDGGGGRWREAVTTVAGVRVIISGPMQVGRRAA